jgi:protein-S-isoprenylcysteine O-methyltransferase Ste14
MSRWRQARAIALLPGTVTIVIPALILVLGDVPDVGWGLVTPLAVLVTAAGAALIVAGFSLWLWTVRLFAQIGKGTLAPWDPTKQLVAEGPYRHLRNPMITGVTAFLLGAAAVFGSVGILIEAAIFATINHVWFVFGEEPGLERRFGADYREYRENVPRWIPRRSPWQGLSRQAPGSL